MAYALGAVSIVTAKGALLVVPEGARIPKVCLKCGAKKGVVRREQTFVVGAMGKSSPWLGAVVGVGAASMIRNLFREDLGLQVLAIVVICAVAAVVALALNAAARKVTLSLPLCAEHDAAIELARRRRVPVLAGLGLALALGLGGMAGESVMVAVLGVALLILVVVAARAMRMNEAWVHAGAVTDDHVALRVDPAVAKSIAERAEKREAKRAAEAS